MKGILYFQWKNGQKKWYFSQKNRWLSAANAIHCSVRKLLNRAAIGSVKPIWSKWFQSKYDNSDDDEKDDGDDGDDGDDDGDKGDYGDGDDDDLNLALLGE